MFSKIFRILLQSAKLYWGTKRRPFHRHVEGKKALLAFGQHLPCLLRSEMQPPVCSRYSWNWVAYTLCVPYCRQWAVLHAISFLISPHTICWYYHIRHADITIYMIFWYHHIRYANTTRCMCWYHIYDMLPQNVILFGEAKLQLCVFLTACNVLFIMEEEEVMQTLDCQWMSLLISWW